jgi:ACS family hexuronate transporter-like MFS transporter
MVETGANLRADVSLTEDPVTPLRTWAICGLMLLATMLNYMDRQTLAQQASDVRSELRLTNEDYGWLETGFGLAFAVGSLVTGAIADRVSLRWLYPAILLGWSAVGFMTGWVSNYVELFLCRVLLGLFEAGQWPCALAAAQRLLPNDRRPLGNSILQSGASLGAIATPPIVLLLNHGEPGGWRLPFQVVGGAGLIWIVVWLMVIRPRDLDIARQFQPSRAAISSSGTEAAAGIPIRRLFALAVVVITINICWQYFRAWMPMMLENQYGYNKVRTQNFSSLYYLVAGIGCLLAGLAVKDLASKGWPVHRARMVTFAFCVLMTSASMILAALPASGVMLGTLLVIGFGSLGQFPMYYAFTQEFSMRQMGKVTGGLSFVTWISTAFVQWLIGRWIDRTGSYLAVTSLAGVVPVFGLLALLLLWNNESKSLLDTQARPCQRRRTTKP